MEYKVTQKFDEPSFTGTPKSTYQIDAPQPFYQIIYKALRSWL